MVEIFLLYLFIWIISRLLAELEVICSCRDRDSGAQSW